MKSDSEILKKIQTIRRISIKEGAEIQMQQFFEWWSFAIKKPNFEMVKKSIKDWDEFWKNVTDEQFKFYADILKMLEKYWKNIQDKNIE